MIEVDERAALPKLLLKLISGDELTRAADESRQDFEWLPLQANANSVLGQFTRGFIECERTEKCAAGTDLQWVECSFEPRRSKATTYDVHSQLL
jgi:hypothetical protein